MWNHNVCGKSGGKGELKAFNEISKTKSEMHLPCEPLAKQKCIQK